MSILLNERLTKGQYDPHSSWFKQLQDGYHLRALAISRFYQRHLTANQQTAVADTRSSVETIASTVQSSAMDRLNDLMQWRMGSMSEDEYKQHF